MRAFLILLVAVLVAIGVGVGIESASTPLAYGPPGVRFYAAFPGSPSTQVTDTPAPHVRRAWTFTGTGNDAQVVVNAVWLAQVPPNEAIAVLIGTRHGLAPAIAFRDLRIARTSVAGQAATILAGCLGRAAPGRDRCTATLSISPSGGRGRRIEWSVEASASSAAQVRQLLASFAPAER